MKQLSNKQNCCDEKTNSINKCFGCLDCSNSEF
jgi:hypothetical protein